MKWLFVFVVIIVLLLVFSLFLGEEKTVGFYNNEEKMVEIKVRLAETEKDIRKGLMGEKSLGEKEGMLFIYKESKERGFWMKNTFIYLDIIFLDENKHILNIVKNAEPCYSDSCPDYLSLGKCLYVIEARGGFVDQYDITRKTKITF